MFRKWIKSCGILALLTGLIQEDVCAQATVTRDAITGDFHVTYIGASGEQYALVVKSRDKVNVTILATIAIDRDVIHYQYQFLYGQVDPPWQPVFSIDIPCPLEDPALFMERPSNWRAWQTRGKPLDLGCSFMAIDTPQLVPGTAETGFVITSTWLPGIGQARVFGLTDVPVVPSGEDTPDDVSLLIQELEGSGPEGMWRGAPAVAPIRLVSSLVDPATGIEEVSSDLAQTCDLAWITNPGVCKSLSTKLEQAGRALERGRNEAAVGQLQAFLSELEAQHGPEPGKPVNDNAYWLLKVNVEFILGRM